MLYLTAQVPFDPPRARRRAGFSLIELIIVIVIIGIVAAIAVPRLSSGSTGASESALAGNLSALRRAIELYQAEHGGNYPTAAGIKAQLTMYTDGAGNAVSKADGSHPFGPYIRSIPAVNVGLRKGKAGIKPADDLPVGWIYDESTGEIHANANAPYNTY